MTGWLVYDDEGATRNAWFIERLIAAMQGHGHTLTLFLAKTLSELPDRLPDFAIVRTINPSLNAFFEERKIPVFNNAKTARIACDKWATYQFCKEQDISVLPTKLIEDTPPFAFPFVLKSRDGHGGKEVFLIEKEEEYAPFVIQKDRGRYEAQPLCSESGKDMRVYLLGGEIYAAMLRTSRSDFRSNYSLGGGVSKAKVTKRQRAVLEKIYAALQCDFVGVDFIRHHGEWVLNEIEDSVGTRMLYAHTRLDAVQAYADHIAKNLTERK